MGLAKRPVLMYVLGLGPIKVGAAEKFLRRFADQMDRRGWDVVFCFDGVISREFRDYMDLASVHIESLNGQENLGLRCSWRLWTLLRKYRPQAFVYAFHSVIRVFPWVARLAGVKRILFNDRTSRPMGWNGTEFSPLKQRLARALTAPVSSIITVSRFVKEATQQSGISKAPVCAILNGVERVDPSRERGVAFRERFNIPQDALLVTTACWVVEVKGIHVLLDAVKPIVEGRDDFWVAVVGEGSMRTSYQEMARRLGISHRVVFTGLEVNPVAAGVFDACDVYCQPSLWHEAFSFAVAEAMGCQAPVVASNIGGMPEVLADGETGLLFEPGNSTALRAALEGLLADPALRQQMGEAGRTRVLERHSVRNMARLYVERILDGYTSPSRAEAASMSLVPRPSQMHSRAAMQVSAR